MLASMAWGCCSPAKSVAILQFMEGSSLVGHKHRLWQLETWVRAMVRSDAASLQGLMVSVHACRCPRCGFTRSLFCNNSDSVHWTGMFPAVSVTAVLDVTPCGHHQETALTRRTYNSQVKVMQSLVYKPVQPTSPLSSLHCPVVRTWYAGAHTLPCLSCPALSLLPPTASKDTARFLVQPCFARARATTPLHGPGLPFCCV